jgi:S1-C subfamily serine protease
MKGAAYLLALLAAAGFPSAVVPQAAPPTVAATARKAVFVIRGVGADGSRLGTGFLISPDGKAVTALHVIRDLRSAGVRLSSGDVYDSFSVLAIDVRRDLALIQIPGFDLSALELANSNEVSAGQSVLIIGNPQGLEGSITAGIVSAVRTLSEGFQVIQTDAAVNPGNSGGPLIDANGRALGVVDFKLSQSENLNFVIPINYVRGMLQAPLQQMTLADLRAKLEGTQDLFVPEKEVFPATWKSLMTGTERRVRRSDDHIYLELITTAEQRAAGVFGVGELTRQGASYVGTWRQQLRGSERSFWSSVSQARSCISTASIELTLVSANRIEGRVMTTTETGDSPEIDWSQCRYKKEAWQKFIWIPE